MSTKRDPMEHLILRFGKALTLEPASLARMPDKWNERGIWITFGYFDTLQILPLPDGRGGNWLQEIYKNDTQLSQDLDGRFYFHPVHIMARPGKAQAKQYETFAGYESPYCCVTLLQSRLPAPLDGINPFARLEALVSTCLGQAPGAEHPSPDGGTVWFGFQSLNLSDFTILWYSRSLNSILEKVQMLYRHPLVGDLHSIPAVRLDCLRACTQPGGRLAPELIPVRETLHQVVTRYLVRDAQAAAEYFRLLPEEDCAGRAPLFTTGIEDLNCVSQNVDSRIVLNTLAHQVLGPDPATKAFRAGFLECETHLGVPDTDMERAPLAPDERLVDQCRRLLERFQALRPRLRGVDTMDGAWMKACSGLLNALQDMSRNTVADGFCFLILGAAQHFCAELGEPRFISSEQLELIQRFLRGWGNLMEQSLRQDGKFSQQPGFSPALCDIPSRLLEFYLAFTDRCGQAMDMGSPEGTTYRLMLIPKLCRRIKVQSVFLQKPDCKRRLLYVDIPLALMYTPFAVLFHLCHEIAHYSGGQWRLRKKRAEFFLRICAIELDTALEFQSPRSQQCITAELLGRLPQDPCYLEDLHQYALERTMALLREDETMDRWMSAAYGNSPAYHRLVKSASRRSDLLNAYEFDPSIPRGIFFLILSQFATLFKECYADLAAIFTLGLQAREYVELIRDELTLYQRAEKTKHSSDYYLTVERWVCVLQAAYDEKKIRSALAREDWPAPLDGFVGDLRDCWKILFTDADLTEAEAREFYTHHHRQESLTLLTDYLSSCLTQMRASEGDAQQLDLLLLLRRAFELVARGYEVGCDACWRILADYEALLLNQP